MKQMHQPTAGLLRSKQHFQILDGMRGVAALAVVVFHFMEVVYSDYSKNFIGHGFLAVDFFFCLSGFVIAYAYDDRMKKMGMREFFKSRIIRLHPLVILGSVLGLLGFLFDPFGGQSQLYSAGKILIFFLTSIFLIPFPAMSERFFNLFSFNAPAWSLFWEYIANIIYGLILWKIARRYLLLLTILSGIAICFISYRTGSLMGGWAGENFWDGCARVSYSFLAGMLVYRSNWIVKSKMGFVMMSVLLALSFIMPHNTWNWLTEPLVILFYYPLLVALGAGATLSPRSKKISIFSGQISYPLYMTHYAAIWIFGSYFSSHKPSTNQLLFIIPIATILLIGFAYLAMVVYDTPIRKYLTEKWRGVRVDKQNSI